MKFTITEMSVGEILERAVKVFFTRLPTFFLIELIVMAPTLILQLAMPDVAINPLNSILFILPMLILGPIGSAAILRVITQEYLEQPTGLGDAFKFALGRFLPLLGTSILAGLGILAGFFLCCIPGIYLAVVWTFISQVVVLENLAGTSAISRSQELVDGFWWRVFGVLLLVGFCVGAMNMVVNTGLTVGLPFVDVQVPPPPLPGQPPQFIFPVARLTSYTNFAVVTLVSTLVNTIGTTFIAICTTLLYFDLRNRKQPFNLDQIIPWADDYRSWRDEPDANLPVPGASAKDTGIRPSDGTAPPPSDGIKPDAPQ